MGSEIVEIDEHESVLTVDGRKYDFTQGLLAFIMQKYPHVSQWPSRDYRTYKSLFAQTKLNLTRIQEFPVDRVLHGNISISLRE